MVCTIGPASDSIETLESLIKNGMNIARLNFSHGDHQTHLDKLTKIREVAMKLNQEENISIMLDTRGPEIRTCYFEKGNSINLVKGQKLRVSGDILIKGNTKIISLSYPDLIKSMKAGKEILIDNGNLSLIVDKVKDYYLETTVQNSYSLGEMKNVNLAGIKVDIPVLTDKDKYDIQEFGVVEKVDFIGLSFVRSRNCVETCRRVLGEKGKNISIISKIENEEGLENLEEIVKVSDAIMIARGDLGMELNPSKMLVAQKFMTQVCRRYGKPIICSTQMLDSMTKNSRPSRAEMSDVGNAILDSVDSVMLCAETGDGLFVVESAQVMNSICREVEMCFDFRNYFNQYKNYLETQIRKNCLAFLLARTSAEMSYKMESTCLIVLDSSGEGVRFLSTMRLRAYIICPSSSMERLRKMSLLFGVFGVHSQQPKDFLGDAFEFINKEGLNTANKSVILFDLDNQDLRIINA